MAGSISLLYVILHTLVWISCFRAQETVEGAGATSPLPPYHQPEFCRSSLLVADEKNSCWFWRCVQVWDDEKAKDRQLIWTHTPQRCALGSYISENFTASESNPCSVKFPPKTRFDCTRGVESTNNVCETMTCLNGGTKVVDEDDCRCECPGEWRGADDCGLKTGAVLESEVYQFTEGCNDAEVRDHCVDLDFPCMNGGTCVSTCTGFWCKCKVPFTAGLLCQKFSCDTDNLCKNGGTCLRGSDASGYDEYQVCRCTQEWEGMDCSKPKRQQ